MDNPFAQGTKNVFDKTIADLQGMWKGNVSGRQCDDVAVFVVECVTKLREEFEDTRLPLTDDNTDLQRFFHKLEYLLQAGLKSSSIHPHPTSLKLRELRRVRCSCR